MNEKAPLPAPVAPGLKIGDIYYVLFRHKWKIIILSLMGVGLAVCFHYFSDWEKKYSATAKLMVKYIVESKAPTPARRG